MKVVMLRRRVEHRRHGRVVAGQHRAMGRHVVRHLARAMLIRAEDREQSRAAIVRTARRLNRAAQIGHESCPVARPSTSSRKCAREPMRP